MFTNSCAAVHAQVVFHHLFRDDTCCLQCWQDGPYEKLYIAHETDVSEHGRSVTISVRGRHHSMTVQEISIMPVSEFACLWTVHSITAHSLLLLTPSCTATSAYLHADMPAVSVLPIVCKPTVATVNLVYAQAWSPCHTPTWWLPHYTFASTVAGDRLMPSHGCRSTFSRLGLP